MSQLAPCPSCRRHIRLGESACPFCKNAISQPLTAIPGTNQRLKRAAAFAFTATLAIAGCSDDNGGNQPVYGAPVDVPSTTDVQSDTPVVTDVPVVIDAAADVPRTDAAADVPTDDGGFLAMYGGPPQDAGVDAASDASDGGPQDSGGSMALYGLPPPDVAEADTGGGGLRYGAPPPRDWDC